MEDFIKGLYAALPAWARVLADPIISRLAAVFRWVFGLFKATIIPWRTIVTGAKMLRLGVPNAIFEIYYTLRWLKDIFIPRVGALAREAAVRILTALLNKTVVPIVRDLMALRVWALKQIADLGRFVRAVREVTVNGLRNLGNRILAIEKRIFSDWVTPARLALWLVGAMWSALWRYGWTQIDRLAEFFWRRRQAILLRSVAEIERQLGRLM